MSPEDLVKALHVLGKKPSSKLLVGPSTLDDAGVVMLQDDLALVQTVDFFPPIVDDPAYYGRIAAANALSDVFAMGGKVHSCLSIVGWPAKLPPELLGEIMKGGQEKIDEAGGVLAGGHTVTDSEIKYGLAVTGTIDPKRVLTNAGAKVGDVLVLTKPLGMGAVATGIKQGKVGDDLARGAMELMATLNRAAAEAAVAHDAECGVTIEIEAAKLPAFGSALELIERGVLSGGCSRTREFLGTRLEIQAGVPEARAKLSLDAETSGGLLIAVPEGRVDSLVADLERRGTPCAVPVGRCVERGEHQVVLRA